MIGTPFKRAAAMMSLVIAALAMPITERLAAMASVGTYKSRGHGEGRSNRRAAGANMAFKRAAAKARNKRARK